MKSKNKNLFLKIYIPFVIVTIIALIVLQILGSKKRIGYLTDFNINKAFELNNLEYIINEDLDEETIKNYLLTNESITNYEYHFRIRYYDKVFRHSDIYSVYPYLSNLSDFIKEVKMDYDGSPFGNLISDKLINEEKIDINYTLKVRFEFTTFIVLILFILLLVMYHKNIKLLILYAMTIIRLKYNDKILNIFKFNIIIIILYITLIISFSILGNIKREGYLNELTFIKNYQNAYIYNFKLNYTDNFFNNNNILYRVNHYISSLPDNIKELRIKDYKNSYGELISSNIIDKEKIGCFYTLNLNNNIFYILVIMIYILLFLYMVVNLYNKDLLFIGITLLIAATLFFFQYWICFPGATEIDTWSLHYSGVDGNNYDNWHPAFISIMLNLFFKLFGYHIFYMFFIILIFWYLGLSIIIISLYIKFKNKYVLWLFLLSFLPNIFYMNIWKLKDTFALSFLWIASSLIFFTTLIKVKNNKVNIILNILSILLLICAMLSRHNFIVSVYPIFLIFTYHILKNKNIINIKEYAVKFLCIMLLFAICLLGIHELFPKLPIIIPRSAERASFAVYEYQIKNIAQLSDDISLIPEEWYLKDKDDNYIVSINGNYKSNSDIEMHNFLNYVFDYNKMLELGNAKHVLIKYILKYPLNYFKFILRYNLKLYTLNLSNGVILNHIDSDYFTYYYPGTLITESPKFKLFMDNSQEFSIRHLIFLAFFKHNYLFRLDINMIIFIILSLILFLIPIIIFILKRSIFNDLLLLTFTYSFSALATTIIVGLFTPVQEYRYMYPVIPISIISLISFITFIYDRGGFKKFIKELRGNKK